MINLISTMTGTEGKGSIHFYIPLHELLFLFSNSPTFTAHKNKNCKRQASNENDANVLEQQKQPTDTVSQSATMNTSTAVYNNIYYDSLAAVLMSV